MNEKNHGIYFNLKKKNRKLPKFVKIGEIVFTR